MNNIKKCQFQMFPTQQIVPLSGKIEDMKHYKLGKAAISVPPLKKNEYYECPSCNKKYVKSGWFEKHLLRNKKRKLKD
jgi:hypothetical protein